MFAVLNPGSSQTSDVPVLDHDVSRTNGFGISQNGVVTNAYRFLFRGGGALQGGNAQAQLPAGQLKILSAIKNGANQSLYVDGTSVASTSVPSLMTTGSNILALGGSAADSRRFNGDIAQILIYNRALSTAERQQVENYLSDAHALFGTKFTFTLDAPYTTSAGVYKPDGTLIRTLWRKVNYGPGTISRSWDGKDDFAIPVASGNYQIKVLYHNTQYVLDGMIGNTSDPSFGPTVHSNLTAIQNLAIDGDRAFYAVGTNEGRSSMHYFSTLTPNRQIDIGHKETFAIFDQVATDGNLVYFGARHSGFNPNTGHYHTFVTAFNASDLSTAFLEAGAPLNTDDNPGNADTFWPSVIDHDIDDLPPDANNQHYVGSNIKASTGIAVQKTGSVLAVAHGGLDVVRFFNKTTGASTGSIQFAPGTNRKVLRCLRAALFG